VRRIAAGVIAVVLFALAALFAWLDPSAHERAAICARVGFVMAALCLALPRADGKVNWWLVGFVITVVLVVTRLPRSFKLLAIAALPILLALFWSRRKRTS
jgi:hypothetical protein